MIRFDVHDVALDQIRAVDAACLVKRLGPLDAATGGRVLAVLGELFAP